MGTFLFFSFDPNPKGSGQRYYRPPPEVAAAITPDAVIPARIDPLTAYIGKRSIPWIVVE